MDVGTGCGVIALMLAQRYPSSQVDAVEIDGPAAAEAQANAAASPWSDRLRVFHAPFDLFAQEIPDGHYDLIVSNPPYFVNSLPSAGRAYARAERLNTARHSTEESLPHTQLLSLAARLLSPRGELALILPAESAARMAPWAPGYGLYTRRFTQVYTVAHKKAARVLWQCGKSPGLVREDQLTLYKEDGKTPSREYAALVSAFYLWA